MDMTYVGTLYNKTEVLFFCPFQKISKYGMVQIRNWTKSFKYKLSFIFRALRNAILLPAGWSSFPLFFPLHIFDFIQYSMHEVKTIWFTKATTGYEMSKLLIYGGVIKCNKQHLFQLEMKGVSKNTEKIESERLDLTESTMTSFRL